MTPQSSPVGGNNGDTNPARISALIEHEGEGGLPVLSGESMFRGSGVVLPGYATVSVTLPIECMEEFSAFVVSLTEEQSSVDDELERERGAVGGCLEHPDVRLADVGGYRQLVADLNPIAGDIARYREGSLAFNLRPSMLFFGKPGAGKRHLAKALAGEGGSLFVSMSIPGILSEIKAQDVDPAQVVNMIFESLHEAKDAQTEELRKQPGASPDAKEAIVVFLEHFDALFQLESENGSRDLIRQNFLNALVEKVQNTNGHSHNGLVIIAAVEIRADNCEEMSVEANLTHFGQAFFLQDPETTEDRLDILQKGAKAIFSQFNVRLEDPAALEEIAKLGGDSNKAFRNILTIAAEAALREQREEVVLRDLFNAFQVESFGRPQELVKNHRLELVAYHEHGHGFMAAVTGLTPAIISMIPRGDTLGYVLVQSGPLFDPPQTRDDLLKLMLFGAGGRAGELFKYGPGGTSTGVKSDFAGLIEEALSFLRAGMLDNRLSDLYSTVEHDERISPATMTLARQIANNVLAIADKVLKIIGHDRMDKAVNLSISGGKEIYGPEAYRFYLDMLDEDTMNRIQRVLQDFYDNPTGPNPQKIKILPPPVLPLPRMETQ